ncbi:MAG: rod shape-determining protein MreC [Victivallales bacterium]|nr:rod shape-determining protein MreC [Victivallales bacterium]
MTERLLTLLIAVIIGTMVLLLLPPGFSNRIESAARYITHPAQSWADCAARMSRAALGTAETDGEKTPALEKKQEELARVQLEYQSTKATMEQMRWDLRLLGAHQASYQHPFTVSIAKVIKRDPLVSYYDSVMIDCGATDGIKTGQYVVAMPSEGDSAKPELIGVITEVAATASRVMLVTHPEFAIGCAIPTRNITGVLRCPPKTSGLALENSSPNLEIANPMGLEYDSVAPGDLVLTSGMEENTEGTANILVGTVIGKGQREDGMPVIRLKSSAKLDAFSHVMVVLGAKKK